MLARAWTFVSGAWIGVVAWLALDPEPARGFVLLAAVLGGGALLVAAWVGVRSTGFARPAPARAAHAASLAWLAAPGIAAVRLDWAPGAGAITGITLVVLAVALWRARRKDAPPPAAGRWVLRGLGTALLGAALWLGLAVALAERGAGVPEVPEARARLVRDIDARVPTRPLPRCTGPPTSVRVIADRGAHPRLAEEGRSIWLDAADVDGRRQIFRMSRESGALECWTCNEPGNNVRPAPAAGGRIVVFETDRHTRFWAPAAHELHALRVIEGERRAASTRLTVGRTADSHPVFGPDAPYVLWSRAGRGRHQVVAASLHTGHGGILLGPPGVLYDAGAHFAAPLAWSPDARHVLIAVGGVAAPARALDLDPATGETSELASDAGAGADFVPDGGWLALGTAAGGGLWAVLPERLAPLLAPSVLRRSVDQPLFRAGGVRYGAADREPVPELELGDLVRWGEVTGVALAADGGELVLGQRRRRPDGVEERILDITLRCTAPERVPTAERALRSPVVE